jgi:predicted MFS family arabinose efflux permease
MAAEIVNEGRTKRGRPSNGSGMFRALRHRNYRMFWIGAFLSNVGTWMQAVAQGLLMYRLTNSAFWLGLDGFMATAPGLFLTLAGGVFADYIDRRRLLLITQFGAGLCALTLGLLVVTNHIHPVIILVLTFFTGCCMALAGPSYQALTVELVGREDLANAIALNSTQFQLARVVGPALAGVALETLGVAGCFFANAASYLAVIAALAFVKFKPKDSVARSGENSAAVFLRDLKAGLSYVRGRPRIFWLLVISASTSFFGAPYLTMLPVFAHDIFHLNDTGLAMMMAVSGAGSVVGALLLAYLGDFRQKGAAVLLGSMLFAVLLVGFSLSANLKLSLILLFGMGFSIVIGIALINTLLQKLVSDEMRGRVMSMFILSFIGTMPLGNLIAGSAAQRYGAPDTLAMGGVLLFVFLLIVSFLQRRLWTVS